MSQPRAYHAQLFHGDRTANVDEHLVVLDLTPGEPAAAARRELDAVGEQLVDAAAIRPGELDLCWLRLIDTETGQHAFNWRLGRNR